MIDEEITYAEKGYRSTDLSQGSGKKVWAMCDNCGKGRWVVYRQYSDLCHTCSMQTEEHCKKMSDANCGKHHTEEAKQKISDAKKGKYVGEKSSMYGRQHSKESIRKMRDAKKGKRHTEEARKKMSESRKGKYCGKDHPRYGRHHSKETKQKIGDARRGKCIGENNPNWNGGSSFLPYCHKFDERFKEVIRERFGRVCYMCPTTEAENGIKLSVHHVNYDKECLCGDATCEFVPLCSSCHTKTNFDREIWERLILNVLAHEEYI